MSLVENLAELLKPAINNAGFILEEIKVTPLGKRRLIAVIVDCEDRNPNLDEVTVVSREVSMALDNYSLLGDQPFTLEVTTPGVDRPLTETRHWKKNIGRVVKVSLQDGSEVKGRITAVNGAEVILDSGALVFTDIKRAQVEIEFNRKEPQT